MIKLPDKCPKCGSGFICTDGSCLDCWEKEPLPSQKIQDKPDMQWVNTPGGKLPEHADGDHWGLQERIDHVLIGGNHLANLLIQRGMIDLGITLDTSCEEARELAGNEFYDIFVAWKGAMYLRNFLEGKEVIVRRKDAS